MAVQERVPACAQTGKKRGERNEGKGEKKAEAEVEGTSVQKDVGENK